MNNVTTYYKTEAVTMSIQTSLIDLLPDESARINNVMTRQKGTFIQIRATDQIKAELQIAADLRGLTMSSMIHSLITQAIREEKEREPQAFVLTPLPATLNLPKGTLESIDHHKIPKETLPNAKRKNSKA